MSIKALPPLMVALPVTLISPFEKATIASSFPSILIVGASTVIEL